MVKLQVDCSLQSFRAIKVHRKTLMCQCVCVCFISSVFNILICSIICAFSFVLKKHLHFTSSSSYVIHYLSCSFPLPSRAASHAAMTPLHLTHAAEHTHSRRDGDGPFIYLLLWGLMSGIQGARWQNPTVSLKWPPFHFSTRFNLNSIIFCLGLFQNCIQGWKMGNGFFKKSEDTLFYRGNCRIK